MKNSRYIIMFTLISIALSSCVKSGFPKINNLELGYENSKTAYPGEDFHIDAELVAESLIRSVEISIHVEKTDAGETNPAWDFEKIYSYTENLKNTDFHEHVEVPGNIATGSYHFHMAVTDREGNQTEKEADIRIRRK